jgi:hypothetical protein
VHLSGVLGRRRRDGRHHHHHRHHADLAPRQARARHTASTARASRCVDRASACSSSWPAKAWAFSLVRHWWAPDVSRALLPPACSTSCSDYSICATIMRSVDRRTTLLATDGSRIFFPPAFFYCSCSAPAASILFLDSRPRGSRERERERKRREYT